MISVIIPMYNESENIEAILARTIATLERVDHSWEIICVNDGSSDSTLDKLYFAQKNNPRVVIINLARNFGKEIALSAGLHHSVGDAVIPIDADLQHPPEVIEEMVKEWRKGYDVVIGIARVRTGESRIRTWLTHRFYQTINLFSEVSIPDGAGDFRLMDRKVVDAVNALSERTRFMKGIFAWVGFRQTTVQFSRDVRKYGHSNWRFFELWKLALNGLLSFTTFPLRIWTYVGFAISSLAFMYSAFLVVRTLIYGIDIPGYASLVVLILFFSGIQIISLGFIGQYVARIFIETQARPLYIIESIQDPKRLERAMNCDNPAVNSRNDKTQSIPSRRNR